jgi:hypothetical protein
LLHMVNTRAGHIVQFSIANGKIYLTKNSFTTDIQYVQIGANYN